MNTAKLKVTVLDCQSRQYKNHKYEMRTRPRIISQLSQTISFDKVQRAPKSVISL